MNETSGKSSSNLAITEKRPLRPGGCVGIFFKLFDWNKRLARKKLFSKKLLPPARLKRAPKKLGVDEKLPTAKNLLIADENRGGFPNARKHETCNTNSERNREMQAPGLVARLMGLESVPAAPQEKQKKSLVFQTYHDQEKKSVDCHDGKNYEVIGSGKEELNFEKGHGKLDSRPQKLQKTGLFERKQFTGFGAEALQVKSILLGSKKHQTKFVSPVKSPRIRSGRNAARLMQAATKVLEPGMRASNRAKGSLAYSVSMPPQDEVMRRITVLLGNHSKETTYQASAVKSLKGQSACRSCGSLLEGVDSKSTVNAQSTGFPSSMSNLVIAPSQGSGSCALEPAKSSVEQETNRSCQKFPDQSVQVKSKMQNQCKNFMIRRPSILEDYEQHHFPCHQFKSQRDAPSSAAINQRTQRQNQIILTKDRIPPKYKSSYQKSRRKSFSNDTVNVANGSVVLNENVSSCSQPRVPSKVRDNYKKGSEGIACSKQDDSSSMLKSSFRKRRPMNDGCLVEGKGFITCYSEGRRNARANNLKEKGSGFNGHSMNHKCAKSKLASEVEENTASGNKDTDVISLKFSSRTRYHTRQLSPTEMHNKGRDRAALMGDSSQCKKLSSQKQTLLGRDALGSLLEQKLKELTYEDRDELTLGVTPSGKSIIFILQELITALTAAEKPCREDEENSLGGINWQGYLSDGILSPCCTSLHVPMIHSNKILEAEVKPIVVSPGSLPAGGNNHQSPESVLDASFSNNSFFSDSAGHNLHPHSIDFSSHQLVLPDNDADLLDSATSLNTEKARSELTDFVSNFSRILNNTDLATIGLMGFKLNHARDVILNAELLFGNAFEHHANSMKDILVLSLLEKLETFANASQRNPNGVLDFMDAKEGHQLRRFLFDSMLECLDAKYGHYCKSAFKSWTKLPLHVNSEFLMLEIYCEIRSWTDLAGKNLDEIVERELSHSLGQWTDFEIEAYEINGEIENDILQALVNEILIDLWKK